MEIPDFVRRAAEREFPCICLDDYKARDRVDPSCRHDDMQHALEAAWKAMITGGEAEEPSTSSDRSRP